jgi:hypothetical protein
MNKQRLVVAALLSLACSPMIPGCEDTFSTVDFSDPPPCTSGSTGGDAKDAGAADAAPAPPSDAGAPDASPDA